MRSVSVLAVHHNEEKQRFEVVKEITNDDGTTTLNLHVIPEGAFEWKVAEYGLDTIEEAFDVILYEPFEEPVNHMSMSLEEARQNHLSKVIQRKQALGRQANRVSARARLVDAGVEDKFVTAADSDPIEVIKAKAPFRPEVIAEKRVAVHRARREGEVLRNLPREERRVERPTRKQARTQATVQARKHAPRG